MKPAHTLRTAIAIIAATLTLSSCTAEWGADLSSSAGDAYYYDTPFYYGPYYTGTTYPYYWGTPAPVWTNHVPRPGGNAWQPAPTPAPSRPTGNIRPGATGNTTGSIIPPAGTIRPGSVTGGQPGIAMPPAGTGTVPAPGRH